MTAALALQKALRNTLITDAGLTSLVPAASVLDTNSFPAPSPSIILGEDQIVDDGDHIARDVAHIYSTLHVWKKEPSLAGVKAIAGAIQAVTKTGRPELDGGFELMDWHVSNARFLREDAIRELCARYQVREIAFDPHYGGQLMQNLQNDGLPVVSFRQGWITMGPAIKELERAILASRFQHGGNPVLRWNFANIAVQDDGKGNRSFNKGRSTDKIDGAVAAAMAVGRAAQGETNLSSYDTAGDFDPALFTA
jgi:hypothetical protein